MTKPRGRDEVRTAVLAATSQLVAERGPDGFTVRDIAARAGINHALVHRHFGTKADVLEQALAAEADAVVTAMLSSGLPLTADEADRESIAQLLDVLAERPSYWRTLIHAVLDSPEAAIPGTASTTELFAGLWQEADGDGATQTSLAGLTVLGWLIFGQFMADSTGADPAALRLAVAERVAQTVPRVG